MNVLEKILEEIDEEQNGYEADHAWNYSKGLEYAKEIIRSHMGEEKDDGWIPVEERLPEEEGWYQCTCSDKEIWNDDIVRDLHYYPGIKEFIDNIRYETNGLKNIEKYFWTKYVTAWQPLPEPYKEV